MLFNSSRNCIILGFSFSTKFGASRLHPREALYRYVSALWLIREAHTRNKQLKFKKNCMSQNFLCCSQNLPKHICVLKKFILKHLFTVYRLFKILIFGVDPPPPFWKKVNILIFFLGGTLPSG